MSMQWTGEQARAIDARGGNLLLSAAAGSGKTTVLVARVMKLIEEGAGIDRMLVVTFTNAAASDMRAKLSRKLAEAAAAGDALALAIYRECGEQLGRTLAILVDLLNPECIVVGSIFVRSYNEIWPAAEEVLRAEALAPAYRACRVEKALLGEQLGDMAALALAFYHTTPAGETGKGAPQ